MTLHIVILAAGKGKRMQSILPKVLHPIAGKPMLQRIVETAQRLNPDAIHVVIGHEKEQLRTRLADLQVNWVEQSQQLGTGHAVATALPHIAKDAQVLILFGDVPLITLSTLQQLIKHTPSDGLGIVTAKVANPYGLGRIIRNQHQHIVKIIEHADAGNEELGIDEINSGILYTSANNLQHWLPKVSNVNAQGEYYLPDIIPHAVIGGNEIVSVLAQTEEEIQGINDRVQLILLERYQQQQQARQLLLAGVTIMDPLRFDLRGNLHAGKDVFIDVNVILEGEIVIGEQSSIGANCILRNVRIGRGVQIKANSMIDNAEIADGCSIGPFARIRPGTKLAEQVHIGNFVEVKNTSIEAGSKANHLTYLGDAEIGHHVNIGAGTITCNYDGVNKHKTVIEDNVFIGSGTQLIAPVNIKTGATIGAGSTITKEAPEQALTLSRSKQISVPGWQRPIKKTD